MQTQSAIGLQILKQTRESIDLVTLIPTVKAMLMLTDSLETEALVKADVELETDWQLLWIHSPIPKQTARHDTCRR